VWVAAYLVVLMVETLGIELEPLYLPSATFEHFMFIQMDPRGFWQALMAAYLRVKIMATPGHMWNLPWKTCRFGL
jgi:hypothetical protein